MQARRCCACCRRWCRRCRPSDKSALRRFTRGFPRATCLPAFPCHRPAAGRVRRPGEPGRVGGTAPPTECRRAGLYSAEQAGARRARLQSSLPAASWSLESSVEPGRWIVYMGKYADEEALAKKRGELRQLGVWFEPLINRALAPGLSLGHFSTQAAAESELAKAATRGVRTARVLLERPEMRGQLLRLSAADAPLKAQ